MDCNKAGRLMMAYMDKNIEEKDKTNLNHHIDKCDACREEFAIYQEMSQDLESDTVLKVEKIPTMHPPNFESAIMDKISKLSERAETRFKLIFGAYTAIFSFIVVIVLQNININHREISSRLSDTIQIALLTLVNVLQEIFYQFGNYAFLLQYYAAAILVFLLIVYFLLKTKEKIRIKVTS